MAVDTIVFSTTGTALYQSFMKWEGELGGDKSRCCLALKIYLRMVKKTHEQEQQNSTQTNQKFI